MEIFWMLSYVLESFFTGWSKKILDQLKKLNVFCAYSVTLDWYLFQLFVLLKSHLNRFNSFTLSWVDNVTTGKQSFVSVIVNVGSWSVAVPATKKQFFEQVNPKLISQSINGISSALQKLLRYFNGTYISASFVPSFPVCSVIFCLNLDEILL